MTASDYTTAGGGLRLKGGIEKSKKKKKSKKPPVETAAAAQAAITSPPDEANASTDKAQNHDSIDQNAAETAESIQKALENEDGAISSELDSAQDRALGKTKAQLQHEQMRRKRFDERLKREGVKTHKERVEALNTYLSKLSEHHDMPRIGPG